MPENLKNVNAKLTRSDVIVLEVFSLDLLDEETQKKFSNPQNREEVFRTLIEREGIAIKELTLLKKDEMSSFENLLRMRRRRPPIGAFHVVYPENQASGWICCCAD